MIAKLNLTPIMIMRPKVILISKEEIKDLHFPKQDVLVSSFEQILRAKKIKYSTSLGNIFRSKVLIYFEDIEGEKKVETTIWGATDTHAILKGDILIPIHRISFIHY
ncbi:MAG: putative phosphodiesterase [Arenicella sp.]|jgi:predicted phosphodiesterase